ncbi:alkaline shock response membrane anchor protein AmaP [Lacticaseibacillus jixiensis]|uniref:alkaline shock response membrane anchor protein AmaP n=1 Tax=Lacticaseibacillus jixiensis TaxID=3231926 RepID=UPI0036F44DF6
MRPITKLGLGFVAVLGLLQAALVALWFWPVAGFLRWYGPLRYVMLGLTAVVAVVFVVMLLVAIFRRPTTNHLRMPNARGELALSKDAVANTVAKAVAQEHAVKGVDVDVAMHQRRQEASVNVEAYSLSNVDLKEEGKRIEATVIQKVTELLGVSVKKVKVVLHPAQHADRTVKAL